MWLRSIFGLTRRRYSLGRTGVGVGVGTGGKCGSGMEWNGTDFGFAIVNRVGICRRYLGAPGLLSRLLSSEFSQHTDLNL